MQSLNNEGYSTNYFDLRNSSIIMNTDSFGYISSDNFDSSMYYVKEYEETPEYNFWRFIHNDYFRYYSILNYKSIYIHCPNFEYFDYE